MNNQTIANEFVLDIKAAFLRGKCGKQVLLLLFEDRFTAQNKLHILPEMVQQMTV
ncbi:hypothetical protein JYU23_01265 [bacterium AH-315-C07]|nr:hypothetical protein [bacterium AH-315-C07]